MAGAAPGLAIGLHAVEDLGGTGDDPRSVSARGAISEHLPLAERIEGFWSRPENRRAPTWRDHLDINEVMLATSLAPGGYLRV